MAKSLSFYYDILFWINYAFFWSYIAIKLISAALLFLLEPASRQSNSRLTKVAKITKPMRWLILKMFGGPLGIVERHDEEYKDEQTDDNDIPKLYIRNKTLSYGTILVLAMLIVEFGILALSTAVNLSLLRVTHVCSEDPLIDCYPQLIIGANDTIVDMLNITIDTSEPITDCSFYNSEGVSSQITFDCFQLVYNTDILFAALGGLATFFTAVMNFATGILLWLNECCECCIGCCTTGKKVTRIAFVIVAFLVEITLAILCMIFGLSGTLTDIDGNSTILRFVTRHAVEVLIVFGILSTLLLLPWERYVDKDEEDDENYII